MGLVLRLKKGEIIKLNDDIFIEIVLDKTSKLALHIVAPDSVKILRLPIRQEVEK